MVRRQIRLGNNDYKRAEREAASLGISLSEFARRAVRAALPPDGQRSWMTFAGMVETGDPQSSRRIDGIIYGQRPPA